MMLTEQAEVAAAALPVEAFKEHLQLGRGFADDGVQDPVLITCLRAAIAAVEAETGKALLSRAFKYSVSSWRDYARQALPLAPVTTVTAFRVTDILGAETMIGEDLYRLVPDYFRPSIVAKGWSLPVIPEGGTAEIEFEAGFGATWDKIPADIGQAVFMLAAHFYDNRSALTDRGKSLPHGVAALLRRHQPVRLLGGGR